MRKSDDTTNLKDLIYFDEDKASSLLSQFEGGLPKELEEGSEVSEDQRSIKKAKLKVFEGEYGGVDIEKLSTMKRKILHHDLLNRVESFLNKKNIILDLNEACKDVSTLDSQIIRELLEDIVFIRAEGYCTINDFDKLKRIMGSFDFLIDFINQSNEYSIKNSAEYQQTKKQLEEFKKDLKNINDRNVKARKEKLLESKEKDLEKIVDNLSEQLEKPEEWILEGYSKWVDILNSGQIHLRLKPFEELQDFTIVSNLMRNYFVESDIDHLNFSYGQEPDVKFTVIGTITSKPQLQKNEFEPREIKNGAETPHSKLRQFENAILNIFDAMEGVEDFGRFATYPNITVYPIAVYRKIISQA